MWLGRAGIENINKVLEQQEKVEWPKKASDRANLGREQSHKIDQQRTALTEKFNQLKKLAKAPSGQRMTMLQKESGDKIVKPTTQPDQQQSYTRLANNNVVNNDTGEVHYEHDSGAITGSEGTNLNRVDGRVVGQPGYPPAASGRRLNDNDW